MSQTTTVQSIDTIESQLKSKRLHSFAGIYDGIVTWVFGVVFLISGIHWGNPYFFLGSVYAYKLVDPGIGQMVVIGMPLIQLVLAICFLTHTFLDAAHLGTLFLSFVLLLFRVRRIFVDSAFPVDVLDRITIRSSDGKHFPSFMDFRFYPSSEMALCFFVATVYRKVVE